MAYIIITNQKKIMPPPLGGSKLKSCFCVPTSLCALIKGGVGVRGPVPPPFLKSPLYYRNSEITKNTHHANTITRITLNPPRPHSPWITNNISKYL